MCHKLTLVVMGCLVCSLGARIRAADRPYPIGRLHRIDMKADHPKAYHPAIGDLVQCYIDFPVVPGHVIDDLKVKTDGSALALVAKVNTSRPGIVGSGQYSVFLAPRQAGLIKVVIQPMIPDRDDVKPIEITFLVQLERER